MMKPINVILLATDLTPNCQQAYEFAVAMAIRNKALLNILYVIDDIPENVEGRMKSLVGTHQWHDLMAARKEHAYKSLTGKRLSSQVLDDIRDFCNKVGMDGDSCAFHSRQIIIEAGTIPGTIIQTAREKGCDIIIMGSHDGLVRGNSIGKSIKAVLKRSPLPVIVVPAGGK